VTTSAAGWYRRDGLFYPTCALLLALAIGLRRLGLPFQTHDMQDFLLPWFDYIVTHGRFAALSDNFYNYTPPYIYMMMAVSWLDGLIDRVTLIKSISFLFDGIAAFVVYRIAVVSGVTARRAILAALLFLDLPTLILNGAFWGQCDVIYMTFLLAFAYYLIRNCPFQAMLMYGIAISIKVQAIFAAPFIVYLLLAGLVPIAAIIMLPLAYFLLILPAALAGRGWISLLTIYAGQAGIAQKLSARAPNIYLFVQHFLPPGLYPAAGIAAIGLAGLASLALLWSHFRMRRPLPALFIIAALALWLAMEPSLLPKMHDRYFFGADVFAFVLAVLIPRAWWIAALMQIGSALAYAWFLMIDHPSPIELHPAAFVGAAAAIPATIGLGFYYWRVVGGGAGSGAGQRPTAQSNPSAAKPGAISASAQGGATGRLTNTKPRSGGSAPRSK
jgi:Gpi18-like mannosyltransferase